MIAFAPIVLIALFTGHFIIASVLAALQAIFFFGWPYLVLFGWNFIGISMAVRASLAYGTITVKDTDSSKSVVGLIIGTPNGKSEEYTMQRVAWEAFLKRAEQLEDSKLQACMLTGLL
jgi:hypothetical protein